MMKSCLWIESLDHPHQKWREKQFACEAQRKPALRLQHWPEES
jgi:hypothetical protein